MTRSRVVLFDLDGTLSDSRPGIFRSMRHAFDRLSQARGELFALPDDDALAWVVGPPLRNTFAELAGPEHVDALIGFYRERYRDIGAFETEIYEGAREMLETLSASARLFVATSKTRADAVRIIEHFGLTSRFEAVHGSEDDGGLADKTELIGHLLATRGLSPAAEQIVMVGDRKFDVIGARNCGLKAIGALWGYGGAEELADADALAERPLDVVALSSRL